MSPGVLLQQPICGVHGKADSEDVNDDASRRELLSRVFENSCREVKNLEAKEKRQAAGQ